MKKTLKIIGFVILVIILFRGFFFRQVIAYSDIGSRPVSKLTNQELTQQLEAIYGNKNLTINDIVSISHNLTSSILSFTTGSASSDPSELIVSKQANCIGYAALFNAVATHLIESNALQQEFEVLHKIAKLEFLGVNLHQFSDSPFFKDHDFNIILNKKTGEVIAVDASVYDYLGIDRITLKEASD